MNGLKILFIISAVIFLSGCSSTEELQTLDAGRAIKEGDGKENLPSSLIVENGVIFFRKESRGEKIEFIFNIGENENIEYEIEFAPPETEKSDHLPAQNSTSVSGESKKLADRLFLSAQGYFLEGNYRRALVEVNRALREDMKSGLLWALKGSIHYKLNEFGLARNAWSKSQELDKDITGVREMLLKIGT